MCNTIFLRRKRLSCNFSGWMRCLLLWITMIQIESVVAISGGRNVTEEEYRELEWVVSISGACGGSLIDPLWVLTAAHCVTSDVEEGWADDLFILHHCDNLLKCNPIGKHRVDVEKVIPHPCFFPMLNTGVCQNSHDTALLKLKKPINIKTYASIDTDMIPGLNIPGFEGMAFGWGGTGKYDKDDMPQLSDVLRMAMIATDPERSCVKKWSEKGLETNLDFMDDALFCAGTGDGRGVCEGDSGGPLAARIKKGDGSVQWVVYGTVSRGTPDWSAMKDFDENDGRCNAKGRLGVFTAISYYSDWLKTAMATEDNGTCNKLKQCWVTAVKDPNMVKRTADVDGIQVLQFVEDDIIYGPADNGI